MHNYLTKNELKSLFLTGVGLRALGYKNVAKLIDSALREGIVLHKWAEAEFYLCEAVEWLIIIGNDDKILQCAKQNVSHVLRRIQNDHLLNS